MKDTRIVLTAHTFFLSSFQVLSSGGCDTTRGWVTSEGRLPALLEWLPLRWQICAGPHSVCTIHPVSVDDHRCFFFPNRRRQISGGEARGAWGFPIRHRTGKENAGSVLLCLHIAPARLRGGTDYLCTNLALRSSFPLSPMTAYAIFW